MPAPEEMMEKFWRAAESDRRMTVGPAGIDESYSRPMTGRLDGDDSPIRFFSATVAEPMRSVPRDNEDAGVWGDGSTLPSVVMPLSGVDPKKDRAGSVGPVSLS